MQNTGATLEGVQNTGAIPTTNQVDGPETLDRKSVILRGRREQRNSERQALARSKDPLTSANVDRLYAGHSYRPSDKFEGFNPGDVISEIHAIDVNSPLTDFQMLNQAGEPYSIHEIQEPTISTRAKKLKQQEA